MNRIAAIAIFAAATARADEAAIRGVARHDGKPVAGVKVWLLTYDGKTIATAATDGEGRFALPVGAGQSPYAVFARSERHVGCQHYQFRSDDEFAEPEIPLALSAAAVARGRLLDAGGKPLPGRTLKHASIGTGRESGVFALPRDLRAEHSPVTAADGTFVIPGVPASGSASVKLEDVDYIGAYLRVDAGERRDYRLDAPGRIRLKFDGAKPPAGTVQFSYGGAEPSATRAVVAFGQLPIPAGGEAALGPLYPQTYSLRFEFAPDARLVAEREAVVTVRPGETADVTVKVTPAARLRGRVVNAATGVGVPDVFVMARDVRTRENPTVGTGRTDSGGRFDFLCRSGSLSVFVQLQPFEYAWHEVPTQYVEAAPGADVALADFKARRLVSAKVLVVVGNGQPVPGATVRTAKEGYFPRGGAPRTDAAGRVTLERLDPEDFTVLRARTATAVTEQPVRLAPGETPEPVKLTLSETAAFRVAARVVDAAGKPVAGAEVRVEWRYRGVGKQASYGFGGFLGKYRTDADGRVTTQAMWPGDEYRLRVAAEGYGATESALVRGEPGQTHDFGPVKLVRVGQIVSGRVVDADGKPVSGVRVFNEGDAPQRLEATTAADGSFTLKGFFDGPCWVFARHPAYRFAAVRTTSGDAGVTVRLVAPDVPPAAGQPVGRSPEFAAAERALALHLATEMWTLPGAKLQGFDRRVLEAVVHLDPELARRWYGERRKAGDADAGETGRLTRVIRRHDAEKVADDDLDEAFGLVSQFPPDESFEFVLQLAKKFNTADPTKAMRCLQEAAVRARALRRYPTMSLARIAEAAIDGGRVPEGRKLLAECVAMAENTPPGGERSLGLGRLAVGLAGIDLDTARKMLAKIDSVSEYNRWLGEAAIKLAADDPERAVKLLGEEKPDLSHSAVRALANVAVRAAAADPARATAIAESVSNNAYGVAALAGIAAGVGRRDPELARTLIDRCLDRLMDRPEDYESWSNFGGRLGIAAAVAVQARAAGYPDLASVTARVLACRPRRGAGDDEHLANEITCAAAILALTDPAAAKSLLTPVALKADRRETLFAVALADPAGRGRAAVDAALERAKAKSDGVGGTSLIELVGTLSAPPGGERVAQLRVWVHVLWLIDGRGEE